MLFYSDGFSVFQFHTVVVQGPDSTLPVYLENMPPPDGETCGHDHGQCSEHPHPGNTNWSGYHCQTHLTKGGWSCEIYVPTLGSTFAWGQVGLICLIARYPTQPFQLVSSNAKSVLLQKEHPYFRTSALFCKKTINPRLHFFLSFKSLLKFLLKIFVSSFCSFWKTKSIFTLLSFQKKMAKHYILDHCFQLLFAGCINDWTTKTIPSPHKKQQQKTYTKPPKTPK